MLSGCLVATFGGLAACATEPGLPTDNPGLAVPGPSIGSCGFAEFSQCVVWSADSKELYAVDYPNPNTYRVVGIDPVTRASRPIGQIGYPARIDLAPGDPAAIYYSTTTNTVTYSIHRFAFSNASSRELVPASPSPAFSISPDGRRLAYHTAGATVTTDTVAVIDVETTNRVASLPGYNVRFGDFSPDGSSLVVASGLSGSTGVWNIAAGSVTPVPMPVSITFGYLRAARWDGTVIRGLFVPITGSTSAMKDVGFYSGDTLAYAPVPYPDLIAWLPSMKSAFVTRAAGECSSVENCGERHYELLYTSFSASKALGSINTFRFTTFVPSPDGKWLAYKVIDRPLYLIARQ